MKVIQISAILASVCLVFLLSGLVYGVGYSITGLASEKSTYSPGSKVTISGVLKQDGSVQANAYVNVEVTGPTKTVWLDSSKTDSSGVFNTSFALASDADAGNYTVYATYTGVKVSTTFAVAIVTPEYPISASVTLIITTILLLSVVAGLRRLRMQSSSRTAIPPVT